MRPFLALLLALPALAGCLSDDGAGGPFGGNAGDGCRDRAFTWYLSDGLRLQEELPEAGRTPGNGFAEAFLTNDLDEWHSPAFDRTWRVEGNVSFVFWTEGNAMPAPIVIGGDPGEGYHFFNQFGTDAGFVESYAIEYGPAVALPDVTLIRETFQMPDGGLLIEEGDHLRLLLTNLVLDDPQSGRGPDILWGGDTPSALSFTASCEPTPRWTQVDASETAVSVPLHRGLLTGAVPAQEGLNFVDVPFTLDPATERLRIAIAGNGIVNEPKSDIDLTVHDANGTQVWSIGTPYTDEAGTLWWRNLQATMPPGDYTVRVNSYSGHGYSGNLAITQEMRP